MDPRSSSRSDSDRRSSDESGTTGVAEATNRSIRTSPRRNNRVGDTVPSMRTISSVGVWFNRTLGVLVIATLVISEVILKSTSAKNPIGVELPDGLEFVSPSVPRNGEALADLVEQYDAKVVTCMGDRPSCPGTYLHVNSGVLVAVSEKAIADSRNGFGLFSQNPGTYVWLSDDTYLPTDPAARATFFARHEKVARQIAEQLETEFTFNS